MTRHGQRVERIAPWAKWLPRGFCFMDRGRGSGVTAVARARLECT
jgi:hypothetical protein